jgi:hypothetical protein
LNATPTVSAYAHLSGPFDYNKMPLAPMGCEVLVHEKTDKRGTWAYHCVDGWYLNTSPDRYRVHNCHIKATRADRLSDTVQFKHKHLTNPEISPHDKIMHALANCKAALMGVLATKSDAESSTHTKEIGRRALPSANPQPQISEGAGTRQTISSKGAGRSGPPTSEGAAEYNGTHHNHAYGPKCFPPKAPVTLPRSDIDPSPYSASCFKHTLSR